MPPTPVMADTAKLLVILPKRTILVALSILRMVLIMVAKSSIFFLAAEPRVVPRFWIRRSRRRQAQGPNQAKLLSKSNQYNSNDPRKQEYLQKNIGMPRSVPLATHTRRSIEALSNVSPGQSIAKASLARDRAFGIGGLCGWGWLDYNLLYRLGASHPDRTAEIRSKNRSKNRGRNRETRRNVIIVVVVIVLVIVAFYIGESYFILITKNTTNKRSLFFLFFFLFIISYNFVLVLVFVLDLNKAGGEQKLVIIVNGI